MKPSEALALNLAAIRQVVESHGARKARVISSVLRGQDCDLDILVDPTPETSVTDVALDHIVTAIDRIARHTSDLDQDAVIRNTQIRNREP